MKSDELTKREAEVLQHAASGRSTWHTAQLLNISEHTVAFHRKRAIAKLEVVTIIQAVAKAIRTGAIA